MAAKSQFVPKFQKSISYLFLDRSEQNFRQNVCFAQFFSLKGIVVELLRSPLNNNTREYLNKFIKVQFVHANANTHRSIFTYV